MRIKNINKISSLVDVAVAYDPVFTSSVFVGLKSPRKIIESKWLYDEKGSKLFDDITDLEEYYPTRVETDILRRRAGELARYLESDTVMVELGSGSSVKTRLVLDALPSLKYYVPLDISKEHLEAAASGLANDYPSVEVIPVVADFTADIILPEKLTEVPKLLFFPGSTIGNFEVDAARKMLQGVTKLKNVTAFVLGFDLVKDIDRLVSAYDDSKGVTAAFNLNLLKRINRELHADFNLDMFYHEARWNDKLSRIEMHLVSKCDQDVYLLEECLKFRAGETIHTENSHKYTPDRFAVLAKQAGWDLQEIWSDKDKLFGVAVLHTA